MRWVIQRILQTDYEPIFVRQREKNILSLLKTNALVLNFKLSEINFICTLNEVIKSLDI